MSARPGIFVCLVGPSGAGKDTLLRLVREKLAAEPGFGFPRRGVTRPRSAHEDHAEISEDAYAEGLCNGHFALAWRAHGLGYAIGREVFPALAAGDVVICNVSRDAVAAARRNFPRVAVVLVTAPDKELALRLSARGRETSAAIDERLRRNREFFEHFAADFVVDNSGSLPGATKKLATILRGLRTTTDPEALAR
ncbi:MAG: phosphonate metabolism protein/1,5-bisphosphokinase (PRPP-forming) PhnN [Methylovirgula sp.]